MPGLGFFSLRRYFISSFELEPLLYISNFGTFCATRSRHHGISRAQTAQESPVPTLASSMANRTAFQKEYVQSSSLVGPPWCCIKASHSIYSEACGGLGINPCALRMNSLVRRPSQSAAKESSRPYRHNVRSSFVRRHHSAFLYPLKIQLLESGLLGSGQFRRSEQYLSSSQHSMVVSL